MNSMGREREENRKTHGEPAAGCREHSRDCRCGGKIVAMFAASDRLPILLPLILGAILSTSVNGQAQTSDDAAVTTIGLAAPLSDSLAILGEQVVAGATAALADDPAFEITTADTTCTAEGGESAARALVAEEVAIVVGFLCTEAIEAALPILTEAGIPVLDVGVRTSRLTDDRDRTGWDVWRLAPRSDAAAEAIADALAGRWANEPFGLIEDGTVANRALVDEVRRRLADRGLKPQVMDNYRPAEEKQFGLARRLQRSGVTRYFVAGDRPDVAVIVRDAAELGLDLELIGGEALLDEADQSVPLAEGITAIAPRPRFNNLAPPEEKAPAEEAPFLAPGGYFGPAYVGVEIAKEAVSRVRDSRLSLQEVLASSTFDTSFGPVAFDAKGDAKLGLFTELTWNGRQFVPTAGG